MFILDTDHLGIIQRREKPALLRLYDRMTRYETWDFHVTIISFHEQVKGWNAYLNRAKTSAAVVFAFGMFQDVLVNFANSQVLPFDAEAAKIFESLRKQKIRIGTQDLRIASTAISNNMTLLSRNMVDFQKVPGLKVEDWTAGPPR